MRIQGLQKLTLLDYPGRTACTVFLSGCNFRCPFCHNAPLLTAADEDGMDEDELLAFLKKRQGLLDGVAVTGGEPLLRPELAAAAGKDQGAGVCDQAGHERRVSGAAGGSRARGAGRLRCHGRQKQPGALRANQLARRSLTLRPLIKAFHFCCAVPSTTNFGRPPSQSFTTIPRF